eukprot:UN06746
MSSMTDLVKKNIERLDSDTLIDHQGTRITDSETDVLIEDSANKKPFSLTINDSDGYSESASKTPATIQHHSTYTALGRSDTNNTDLFRQNTGTHLSYR